MALLLPSRNSLHFSPAFAGEFCFCNCPRHPPSILPISSIFTERAMYFLLSIAGVDFLGWVNFIDHRILRIKTKRRMLSRLGENNAQSYLGLLSYGNSKKLAKKLSNM